MIKIETSYLLFMALTISIIVNFIALYWIKSLWGKLNEALKQILFLREKELKPKQTFRGVCVGDAILPDNTVEYDEAIGISIDINDYNALKTWLWDGNFKTKREVVVTIDGFERVYSFQDFLFLLGFKNYSGARSSMIN